jgi:cyclopropane-fatty-acyl-phospholipid synthase
MSAPPDRRTTLAAELLGRVFAEVETPLAFRLWDGSAVEVGAPGAKSFAVVLRSPAVLRRLLRRPSPLRFGEAFIAGDLDIEGDLFAAMRAATAIEGLCVPLATRLGVLVRTLTL